MAPASDSTSATTSSNRHRPALAQHDVERIADRVLLREIRGAVVEPRRNRRGDVRMADVRGDERVELGDERRRLFGSEVETKDLDRDEPIASGLVRTEDRTQRARTNLMENPEWPECFRRKVQDRIFAVQRSNGNMNSLHIPVDIRRFPWVKKLAADYAFQFSSLAPFFSGDPASPASWTAAIANAQTASATARRAERAPREAARAPRRARRCARGRAAARRSGNGRHRHGPAGGIVRRSAVHALQRTDGSQARRAGVDKIMAFRPSRSSGSSPKITTGMKWRRCSVLDGELQRRTITLPPPARRRPRTRSARITLGERDRRGDRRARRDAAADRVHSRTARRICGAPTRPASACPMRSLAGSIVLLGELGVIVFDCSDRAAKPLASEIFAHEVDAPRPHVGAGRRSGPAARRGGISRAGRRLVAARRGAVSHRTAREPPWTPRDAPGLAEDAREPSRDVQPERAAAADRRGRALPDRLLRERPERARVSRAAARGVRALRRADAAGLSASERDDARFGERAISRKARPAVRSAAGARRIGAQPPARGVAARIGRSRAERGRRSRSSERWRPSSPPVPAIDADARRRGAIDARASCSTT